MAINWDEVFNQQLDSDATDGLDWDKVFGKPRAIQGPPEPPPQEISGPPEPPQSMPVSPATGGIVDDQDGGAVSRLNSLIDSGTTKADVQRELTRLDLIGMKTIPELVAKLNGMGEQALAGKVENLPPVPFAEIAGTTVSDFQMGPREQDPFDSIVQPAPLAEQDVPDSSTLKDFLVGGFKEYRARGKLLNAIENLELSRPPSEGQDLLVPAIEAPGTELSPGYYEGRRAAAKKDLEEAAKLFEETKSLKHSPTVQAALEAETFGDAWSNFSKAPIRFISEVGVRSAASSIEPLAFAIAGGLTTGPLGFIAGTGLGSAKVEFAASVLEGLYEAGVDPANLEEVSDFVNNPEKMQDLENFAQTRSAVIGTVDAATGGIATKTVAPVSDLLLPALKKRAPDGVNQIENLVNQTIIQAGGGGLGEAGAQVATGQELRPGEIFAEAAGELITTPVDVVAAGVSIRNKIKKGEPGLQYYMDEDGTIIETTGSAPEGSISIDGDDVPSGTVITDEDGKVQDFVPDEDVVDVDIADDEDVVTEEPIVDEEPTVTEDPVVTEEPTVDEEPTQATNQEELKSWLLDAGAKLQTVIDGLEAEQFTAKGKQRKGSFGDSFDSGLYIDSYKNDLSRIEKAYNQLVEGVSIDQLDVGEIRGDIGGFIKTAEIDVSVPYIPMDIRTQSIRESKGLAIESDDRYGEFPFPQTREAREVEEAEPEQPQVIDEEEVADQVDVVEEELDAATMGKLTKMINLFPEGKDFSIDLFQERMGMDYMEAITFLDDMVRQGVLVEGKPFSDGTPRFTIPEEDDSVEFMKSPYQVEGSPVDNQGGFEVPVTSKAKTKNQKIIEKSVEESYPQLPKAFGPGWSYVPLILDKDIDAESKTPYPATKSEILRREKILRPLIKAIGIPVFRGRITSAFKGDMTGTLGYFVPSRRNLRIKNNNNLEVTAHEIAHAIDHMNPEIKKFYSSKAFPEEQKNLLAPRYRIASASQDEIVGPQRPQPFIEVMGFSYTADPSKVLSEGWAEFHRLFLTQPDKAREIAPNTYNWYMNFLQGKPWGNALLKAQEQMTAWYKQDPLSQAESKIADTTMVDDDPNKSLFYDGFDNNINLARINTIDDLSAIRYGLERGQQVGEGKLVEGEYDAYNLARNYRGIDVLMDLAMTEGYPVYVKDTKRPREGRKTVQKRIIFKGEGLHDILAFAEKNPSKKGKFAREFELYLYGRAAEELQRQGRQNRFTEEEIASMVALEDEHPHFIDAFERYQAWNRGIVRFAIDGGILSEDQVDRWQRSAYVPMYTLEVAGPSLGRSKRLDQAMRVFRLKGSEKALAPAYRNIIGNAKMLLAHTLKNEVKVQMIDDLDSMGALGAVFDTEKKKTQTAKITRSQVDDYIEELMDEAEVDAEARESMKQIMLDLREEEGAFVDFLTFNHAAQGKDIVQVLQNGKRVEYEIIDPLVKEAFTLLDRPMASLMARIFAIPARVSQPAITLGWNFLTKSLIRESIANPAYAKSKMIPFVATIKGLAKSMSDSPEYKQFLANGGGYSSHFASEQIMRRRLDKLSQGKVTGGLTTILNPLDLFLALERFSNHIEMATKVEEFSELVKGGMNPRLAAYHGSEMGGDFRMRGANPLFKDYARTVMFLQPAIISIDRFLREVKSQDLTEPGKRKFAAYTAALGLAVGAVTIANKLLFPEEYDELEEWEKQAYINIFYREEDGTVSGFKIPTMYEVSLIAQLARITTESIIDTAEGQDGVTFESQEAAKAFISQIASVFGIPVMPHAATLALEPVLNKDLFTGAPIETMSDRTKKAGARGDIYDSATLKELSGAIEDFPVVGQYASAPMMQHLLESVFNDYATFGLALADSVTHKVKDLPERPTGRSNFNWWTLQTVEGGKKSSKYTGEYYDLLNDLSELRASYKDQTLERNPGGQRRYLDKYMEKGGENAYDFVVGVNRELTELRKKRDIIASDTELTGDEKRDQIAVIHRVMNNVMREVVYKHRAMMEQMGKEQATKEALEEEGIEPKDDLPFIQ